MLAALGAVFAAAGVGKVVAGLVVGAIPMTAPVVAVVTFTLGMALFTMIMGNAFAAFPVMTAAIGLPSDRRQVRRRSGDHGGGRHAVGLLRHADDADGGELQHRARRPARADRPQRGDQGAGADRAPRCSPPTRSSWPSSSITGDPMIELTQAMAERFASIALGHVTREYPNKLDHVMAQDDRRADAARAASDLLRQLRLAQLRAWRTGCWRASCACSPRMSRAGDIIALFDRAFTRRNVADEVAYLDASLGQGFERPYGWAWVLMLAAELRLLRQGRMGRLFPPARERVRRALPGVPAQAHLSDPRRHALQHRLRADPGARSTAASRATRSSGTSSPRARATGSATTATRRPGSRRATISSRPR